METNFEKAVPEREIQIGDMVGYISQTVNENGEQTFTYLQGAVKSIYCGKRSHTVRAEGFRNIDYDELVFNSKLVSPGSKIVLINEPFIVENASVSEHMKTIVAYYNENGAKPILEG